MSIAQFHRALQTRERYSALKSLRLASYDTLLADVDDQLSNWDPWNPDLVHGDR